MQSVGPWPPAGASKRTRSSANSEQRTHTAVLVLSDAVKRERRKCPKHREHTYWSHAGELSMGGGAIAIGERRLLVLTRLRRVCGLASTSTGCFDRWQGPSDGLLAPGIAGNVPGAYASGENEWKTHTGFSREARYAAAGGKFTGAALRPRAGRGKRTEPRIAMDAKVLEVRCVTDSA